MAAIFQIRRGASANTSSLVNGELYLNTSENAFQVGTTTNPIKLLSLNAASFGDIILTGSAYISGNVVLGGNIYLGDNLANDSVNVNSPFSGSIIPSGSNVFDLGSNAYKYRNVYATSISGAIAATNGVISGSSQIAASLPQGVVSGSSQVIGILESLNSLTGSYATTGSNNFRGNQNITGSVSISSGQFNVITGSGGLTSSVSFTHNITAPNDGYAMLELMHDNNVYNDDIRLRLKTDFAGAYIDYYEDGVNYTALSVQSFANKNLYIHQDTRLLFSSLRIGENLTVTGSVTVSGSVIGLSGFTGSFSGSLPIQDGRLDNLESKSASVDTSIAELNSYTSSLKTAITASGTNVTINGNLTVKGTTTQIDSTTLNIGDNIIELNYGGSQTLSGIYTKDATGTLSSGSLLWNSTTDRWIAGVSGSESTILLAGGDGVISSSLQLTDLNAFSQSTNTRLGLLETSTGSLNTFTSSANTRLGLLETSTGSLNTFSSSTLGRLDLIETSTGSLNTFSSSTLGRLDLIEISTGSLNTFSSSTLGRLDLIETSTGSLNTFTSSANSRLNAIEISTASLNVVTASLIISASQLYVSTSLMTASVEDHEERIAYLEGIGGITGGNPLTELHIFSASAKISIANLETFTSSANTRLSNLELTSASLNAWSSSLTTTFATDAEVAAGYESQGRGIVSGSSQIVPLLPTGVVSGSSQILGGSGIVSGAAQIVPLLPTGVISGSSQITTLLPSGVVSGSSQITYSQISSIPSGIVSGAAQIVSLLPTGVISGSSQILGGSGIFSGSSQVNADSITNFDTNVKDKLNVDGVISGSSQVASLLPSGVVSGSSQVIALLPSGVVSGSLQVLGGSTIHSGSSGDYQFNSIGVGTAASTVTGEIRATGDITAFYSSDIRLKENIQPIENALEKVNQISGNTYDWKEGYEEIHSHKGNDVGVIAQEIEQILPQIVTNRDNGYKAVQYEKIIPLLIEAIKELSARINTLENR
jgi:hypothetical protein